MANFSEIANQLSAGIIIVRANMPLILGIISSLYLIHFVNLILGYRLNILGIYPRNIFGLPGIFFSPLLHGNFNHLFFNSIPLFILICLMLIDGLSIFCTVTLTVVVLGGLGVWLFGRKALH